MMTKHVQVDLGVTEVS